MSLPMSPKRASPVPEPTMPYRAPQYGGSSGGASGSSGGSMAVQTGWTGACPAQASMAARPAAGATVVPTIAAAAGADLAVADAAEGRVAVALEPHALAAASYQLPFGTGGGVLSPQVTLLRPVRDYVVLPLAMPVLLLYWWAMHLLAWLLTFAVLPSYALAQRLYWACPFAAEVFARMAPRARGLALRVGFEASYCINALTRLLTLPLRPHLPAFYILGFPVRACGCSGDSTSPTARCCQVQPGAW